jgi:phosphoribosyl 1,2-cyclic phosphate phosphodiesterase
LTAQPTLVFLGSSGAIQVPAFFCLCQTCEAARHNPAQRRTRASAALLGREITLVDASPDLEFQLEREGIRHVDRVFITHWHWDHVAGLAALDTPVSIAQGPPLEVYLPYQVVGHFDQELAYMSKQVNVHPLRPGDRVELPDATWEAVKTTHTDDSIGFIVEASRRVAYLVDGTTPPPATLERLVGLDILILEATVDSLDEQWQLFTPPEAVRCWQQTGAKECILTHLSCHRWKEGQLLAGLSADERQEYEKATPGLRFAYDGMTVTL